MRMCILTAFRQLFMVTSGTARFCDVAVNIFGSEFVSKTTKGNKVCLVLQLRNTPSFTFVQRDTTSTPALWRCTEPCTPYGVRFFFRRQSASWSNNVDQTDCLNGFNALWAIVLLTELCVCKHLRCVAVRLYSKLRFPSGLHRETTMLVSFTYCTVCNVEQSTTNMVVLPPNHTSHSKCFGVHNVCEIFDNIEVATYSWMAPLAVEWDG